MKPGYYWWRDTNGLEPWTIVEVGGAAPDKSQGVFTIAPIEDVGVYLGTVEKMWGEGKFGPMIEPPAEGT